MPIISWTDAYSVGIQQIDDEHKELISIINKAYDASENTSDEATLNELALDLRRYALMHFATETVLMKESGYPDAEEHLRQHKDFTRHTLVTNSTRSADNRVLDPIKTIKYLSDWLNTHILETDMELAKFLIEKKMV